MTEMEDEEKNAKQTNGNNIDDKSFLGPNFLF